VTVTLRDAVNALDERKVAAFDPDEVHAPIGKAALLAVGLDIDIDELHTVGGEIGGILIGGLLAEELAFRKIPSSAWIDGVLTGLLLAQLREREGA